MKSCVEVPEYFYNLVSYSYDELLSCSSTVWSFCFVFFFLRFCPRRRGRNAWFLRHDFRVVWEFFRQKFLMATLKSGFKKGYISGFTSELVATVNSEIQKHQELGQADSKLCRRWLSTRSAIKRVRMLWRLSKTFSPPGRPMRYVDVLFSVLSRIQSPSSWSSFFLLVWKCARSRRL